ncbi:uncharacterized protein LOC143916510 [Arctopsyche grandis]|uniref:uncharacterized protein LOC143916510 n=1 Tax=Arctopsyche grandis TaxID=121162 RepID=UPI00406D749F
MSSSKGNVKRTRPQKHQNRTSFKNDMHDTSVRTKFIKSIQPSGICLRCKSIIEWKIKYKKFKPLTAPKKCVRCEQKTVKNAYHVVCLPCARKEGICAKCIQKVEVVEHKPDLNPTEDAEMQQILKSLPERKRRTLLRYLRKQNEEKDSKKKKESAEEAANEETDAKKDAELTDKINKLKLDGLKNGEEDGDISDFDSDFDDFSGSDIDDSDVEECLSDID